MTTLEAIGWDHPRCTGPMGACAAAWQEMTGIAVSWEWRSLEAFGDQPLEELAPFYDLLVIDHPFCGTAVATQCLRPLDDLLGSDTLAALAADAVGASHRSYTYAGHQWGLATDAACQVAAVRSDLLDGPAPVTWDDVRALARSLPGCVALPLAPAHAISSFLTLCANAGRPPAGPEQLVDRDTGLAALELLSELHRLGPPGTTALEPPDLLGLLTSSDDIVYVPLTYGYVTYARADAVERPCSFRDIASAGHGPIGAVLGGAGLAVSATSGQPGEAGAFAAWASGADAQRVIVATHGGQPGSASAWVDPTIDAQAGGFYSGTIATMEAAWVRPRDALWPGFQLQGGKLLAAALDERLPAATTLDRLDGLYRDHLGGAS
jgi:multiple sugar transport system substrate-binding protein